MSNLEPNLSPRAAFAGLPVPHSATHGIIVSDRDGLGLATVQTRKGQSAALAERVWHHFRIELPQGRRRAAAGNLALAGTGPGTWFATFERGTNGVTRSLRDTIVDLASVSDQSDGYAVLRLSGPKIRDALCKLIPIDVDPRAFKIGDFETTVMAHIGAMLWRLEDSEQGFPVFEIAVYRSFTTSFWHVLSLSAAEFGLLVAQPSDG